MCTVHYVENNILICKSLNLIISYHILYNSWGGHSKTRGPWGLPFKSQVVWSTLTSDKLKSKRVTKAQNKILNLAILFQWPTLLKIFKLITITNIHSSKFEFWTRILNFYTFLFLHFNTDLRMVQKVNICSFKYCFVKIL